MSELSEFRRKTLKKSQKALSEELGYEKWQTYAAQELGKNPLPPEIKDALRSKRYKFSGLFPDEETKEAPAQAGGPFVTERDFGKLEGRIEVLERALEKMGEAVRELALQVKERSSPPGRG